MAQLLPEGLALCEVLDLGDKVQGPTVLVAHQRRAQESPDRMPVLMNVALLDLVGFVIPSQHPPQVDEVRCHVFRMGHIREGLGEQLLLPEAHDAAEGTVDLQETAVDAHERHTDRSILKGALEPLLAHFERPLGPFATRYVPAVDDELAHPRLVE